MHLNLDTHKWSVTIGSDGKGNQHRVPLTLDTHMCSVI